jgi:hypothetical protein
MNGVAAICGFTGILAFIVGLVLFLPATKLKPYRKIARFLSIGGGSLFAIGIVITPSTASRGEQGARNQSVAGRADIIPATQAARNDAVAQEPVPRTPDHNYLNHSGNVYYYAAASTLNEGEYGAAQDVHGFEYAGRKLNADNDTVFEVNSVGMPIHTLWCQNPCSIIHADDGHMLSYQPSSIIGMVFQDIADGKLKNIDVRPIDPPHVAGPSSIY